MKQQQQKNPTACYAASKDKMTFSSSQQKLFQAKILKRKQLPF